MEIFILMFTAVMVLAVIVDEDQYFRNKTISTK